MKTQSHINELIGEATVDQLIRPGNTGRVRFQASWWPAVCEQDISLAPGEKVYVVGHDNITLLVEPADSSCRQVLVSSPRKMERERSPSLFICN